MYNLGLDNHIFRCNYVYIHTFMFRYNIIFKPKTTHPIEWVDVHLAINPTKQGPLKGPEWHLNYRMGEEVYAYFSFNSQIIGCNIKTSNHCILIISF